MPLNSFFALIKGSRGKKASKPKEIPRSIVQQRRMQPNSHVHEEASPMEFSDSPSSLSLILDFDSAVGKPSYEQNSGHSTSPVFFIPEIIEKILFDVPFIDLITSCRATCRQWRSLIDTSSVFTHYRRYGQHCQPGSYLIDVRPQIPTGFVALPPTPLPPKISPAGSQILSIFLNKYHAIQSHAIVSSDPDYLDQSLLRLYESFSSPTFSFVSFFFPPDPIYRHQISILRSVRIDIDQTPQIIGGNEGQHGRKFEHTSYLYDIFYIFCHKVLTIYDAVQITYTFPPIHSSTSRVYRALKENGDRELVTKTAGVLGFSEPGHVNIIDGKVGWCSGIWKQFPWGMEVELEKAGEMATGPIAIEWRAGTVG